MFWYKQSQKLISSDPSLLIQQQTNNTGINGPNDEKPKSQIADNDAYAVGTTPAIHVTDTILEDPNLPNPNVLPLDVKLELLRHDPKNQENGESMSSTEGDRGAMTFKGQNSVNMYNIGKGLNLWHPTENLINPAK